MTKRYYTAITLCIVLMIGCRSGQTDHPALYDTRHPSVDHIIEIYEIYPGLDVPSRYIQNGDTAVIYQLSVEGNLQYKMWKYKVDCSLNKHELEYDSTKVDAKTFRVSRTGLGSGSCEQDVLYSYID